MKYVILKNHKYRELPSRLICHELINLNHREDTLSYRFSEGYKLDQSSVYDRDTTIGLCYNEVSRSKLLRHVVDLSKCSYDPNKLIQMLNSGDSNSVEFAIELLKQDNAIIL